MSLIAELRLQHPRMSLAAATSEVPAAFVKSVYHSAVRPDVEYLFYAVSGCEFETFEAAIAGDPTVTNPTTLQTTEEEHVFRVEQTDETLLLMPRAAELGFIDMAGSVQDGVWSVRVFAPDRNALSAFKSYCEDLGVEFGVETLYSPDVGEGAPADEYGLTEAQREVLETAFRMGYFEEPRRASLEDIAAELGVSSSAVGGRLRRATAGLVAATLSPEDTRGT